MKIFIIPAIAIVLLSLVASTMANTLVLINQNGSRRLGCITCSGSSIPRTSKCVAPGKTTSFRLADKATAGTQALCVGTYDEESHGFRSEKLYYVYNSNGDFQKFKNKVIVKVNDSGFYRSNEHKKKWEHVYPTRWLL